MKLSQSLFCLIGTIVALVGVGHLITSWWDMFIYLNHADYIFGHVVLGFMEIGVGCVIISQNAEQL